MSFLLMNAAGARAKTLGDVVALSKIPTLSDITVGSITVSPRGGNVGTVYWHYPTSGATLNSLGLPNPGAEWYRQNLISMAATVHESGKYFRVSVAGFDLEGYLDLIEVATYGGADTIEVNLGCPNVWGDAQKGIASFSPPFIDSLLSRLGKTNLHATRVVALKLSPFSDPGLLAEVAQVIGKSTLRNLQVVCCNTFPNAFAFVDDTPAIGVVTPIAGKETVGLAGLSGRPMKHIALGQGLQFRKHLPDRIQLVVAGGIESGTDIDDALKIGAIGVQVGSHFFEHGPRVFEEMVMEMKD